VLYGPLLDRGRVFAAGAVLLCENLPRDSFGAFAGDEFLERGQTFLSFAAKLDRDFDALLRIGGAEQLVIVDGDRAFESYECVCHVGVLDLGNEDFGKGLEG
jgi:hypothetical protein